MNAADAIAAAALVVTGIGVVVALKGVRDQLRIATFLSYTERYAGLMQRMPFQARQPGSGYDLAKVAGDERERVLAVFRDYFNLCSEELWLASSGKIDKQTWKVWKMGIMQVNAFPCFEYAWTTLRPEYVVFAEFCRFMDDIGGAHTFDTPSATG